MFQACSYSYLQGSALQSPVLEQGEKELIVLLQVAHKETHASSLPSFTFPSFSSFCPPPSSYPCPTCTSPRFTDIPE